jgi:WD40 repeat protein
MKKIFIIILLGLWADTFSSSQPAAAAAAGAGADANMEIAQKQLVAQANLTTILPNDLKRLVIEYADNYETVDKIAIGNEKIFHGFTISPNKQYVAVTTSEDTRNPNNENLYEIYKIAGRKFNKIGDIKKSSLGKIAISPDGKYIAFVKSGFIELFALKDNGYSFIQKIEIDLVTSQRIEAAFWQRDGKLVFAYGIFNNISLYTLENNTFVLQQKLEHNFNGHAEDHLTGFAFTRFAVDGSTIVTGYNGFLYIWKLQKNQNNQYEYALTIKRIAPLLPAYLSNLPSYFPIQALSLSPDGKYLAVGSLPDKLTIWQLDKNLPIQEITGISGAFKLENQIQFSPDGLYLYIITNTSLKFFKKNNQNTYQMINEMKGASISYPTIFAFTPDIFHAIGKLLNTDSSISLFRLEQLALMRALE